MNIPKMSDKQLMEEYGALSDECFSIKDVMNHELIERELDRRGFEVIRKTVYSLVKRNVEIEKFDKDGKAIIED